MKRIIAILIAVLAFQNTFSQTNIYLNISHMLGNSPLTSTQVGSNNLGNNFTIDRLEYYVGEIVLHHGRGLTTPIPNTWILVDATQPTNELLGNYNITGLTGISFGIGVDTTVNNDDPSLWPTNHPLAPRSPAMHWGWAAGYRFVALEGKTGTSMNDVFQVHALGNVNYYKQTISTTGYQIGADLTININADYSQSLKNISVNLNLFNHGETGEAATLLTNFNTDVFYQGTTGINAAKDENFVSVSPNPSRGEFKVEFKEGVNSMNIRVIDAAGKLVLNKALDMSTSNQFAIKKSGVYTVNFYNEFEFFGTERLIVE
jgi:hypothetical protein